MHVNGFTGTSASVVLNKVHQQLYRRYVKQAYSDTSINSIKNAELLQDFLQSWKRYANGKAVKSQLFTPMLLETIQSAMPKNSKFKFNTSGGVKFEREFGTFILNLLNNEILGTSFQGKFSDALNKTLTGSKQVTSTKSGKYDIIDLDGLAYQILQNIYSTTDMKLRSELEKAYRGLNSQRARTDGKEITVSGKTDVSAKRVEFIISTQIPEQMRLVFQLLSKAQFTLKNYATSGYAYIFLKQKGLDPTKIHFGDSNVLRALVAVLTELGYKMNVIKSIYYSAYASGDVSAQLHIYHIRYVYELTGLGQNYIDKELKQFGEAEFLIWNDPSSDNIYVKSTAQLILEMFNEVFDGNWQKAIEISKKNISKKS